MDSPRRFFRLAIAALIFCTLAGVGGNVIPVKASPFTERCADSIFNGDESDPEFEEFLNAFASADVGSSELLDSLDDAVQTFKDNRGGKDEYEKLRSQLLDFCHYLARLTGEQIISSSDNSFGGQGLARRADEAGDPDGEGMLLVGSPGTELEFAL